MSQQFSPLVEKINPDTGVTNELGISKERYNGHNYTRSDDRCWKLRTRKDATLRTHRTGDATKETRHAAEMRHKAGRLPVIDMTFKDRKIDDRAYDVPDNLDEMYVFDEEMSRIRNWRRLYGESFDKGQKRLQELADDWEAVHGAHDDELERYERELDYLAAYAW